MDIVYALLIGIAAGFLAGQLTKGSGFGWIGNLIVGALGALLGKFVFDQLDFPTTGLLRRLISATVGAVLLLFLLSLVGRRKG